MGRDGMGWNRGEGGGKGKREGKGREGKGREGEEERGGEDKFY